MLGVVRAVSSHVEGQVGSRDISGEGGVIPCLWGLIPEHREPLGRKELSSQAGATQGPLGPSPA